MRAIHSREAARALLILGDVTGKKIAEAEEHCLTVRLVVDGLEARGLSLFCCGPCTASVWRLISIGGLGECDNELDRMLSVLPSYRDKKGTWSRFPFFFTVLALSEIDRPNAKRELEYALPECEKRRKRLKPKDKYSERKMLLLDRVLEALS